MHEPNVASSRQATVDSIEPGGSREGAVTAQPLRFGLLTMQRPPWPALRQRWIDYDQLGLDSLWLCDHFIGQSGEALFEAWTLLAALARVTERARIGTVVTCAIFRHPAILAREALTLDHLSGGRVEIGLGAGWWLPELARYGYPSLSAAERVAHFATTVETVSRLVTVAGYPGDLRDRGHLVLAPTISPAPVQIPRPPLMLAAQSRRMLALVARYGDTWVGSFGLSPREVAARNRTLDQHCTALGRDPATLRRALVWTPWVDPRNPWDSPASFAAFVEAYRAAGVSEFILEEPPHTRSAAFRSIVEETMPRLRASIR